MGIRRVAAVLGLAALCAAGTGSATVPTPGQNVNMVSGTLWPGGDPFLQRQNEPSLAVSTLNSRHLLAAANDSRTVDLPTSDDTWLGVFQSVDGGLSWRSTLLPGYPQDASQAGLTSPLHGYTTASHPLVRAGANGRFYVSGIAFNRATNEAAVFVSSFVDGNDDEAGSPIRYLDTTIIDQGNAGQFLDKPWVAVDIPRGSEQCGTVYLAYVHKNVFLRASNDCGQSWSKPKKLSVGNHLNQGATVTIDPVGGGALVAWRRENTIVFKPGDAHGQPTAVATIIPFDQPSTATSFSTTSYPTIAAESGRIHIAWSQRAVPGGGARIVLATSADGGETWSPPAEVAPGPQGHQFMPAMTVAGGRLTIVYYDSRLDHTIGRLVPYDPFVPDDEGFFYSEVFDPLPGNPFGPFLDDAGLQRRHTIDVFVAQAPPGPFFQFTPVRVSRYPVGTTGGPDLSQLESSPPSLPMFSNGTAALDGDYIDVAGSTMVRDAADWRFSTTGDDATVHLAWTSNQDVIPPLDGDWTIFTPVGGGGPSLYDPTQSSPACQSGYEGTRNQNIYSSAVTQGLLLNSLQSSKPLSPTVERAFTLVLGNETRLERSFRVTIENQPPGGYAWFLPSTSSEVQCPGALCTTLDITVSGRSGVARQVFATSADAFAEVAVEAVEVDAVGGNVVPGGLSASLSLNGVQSPLPLPPGGEDYGASLGAPFITSPSNSPGIVNPVVLNPIVLNPIVLNPIIVNPVILNPIVLNPLILNTDLANPAVVDNTPYTGTVTDPDLTNPDLLGNQELSDATYVLRNDGDTAAAYRVRLVGEAPTDALGGPLPLQLVVTRTYEVPTVGGCAYQRGDQGSLFANVLHPQLTPPAMLGQPALTDPSPASPLVGVMPGEVVLVTLRAPVDKPTMLQLVADVTPVAVPSAPNTGEAEIEVAAPLFILTRAVELPPATVNAPYQFQLKALGGTPPYDWSVVAGNLPPGLNLQPATGQIFGVPEADGAFASRIGLADFAGGMRARDFTFVVNP
jgi:hypothetical protein